jgi:hypothetical protein
MVVMRASSPCGLTPPLALAMMLSLLLVILSGCLNSPPAQQAEPEPLIFSDSRGPPVGEPLIPLTMDAKEDANAILSACTGSDGREECLLQHLEALLSAAGSIHAFDVLESMSHSDQQIMRRSHPMSHVLGAHALYVYGTIANTLANCSHKVFQGCIHGALEEYFRHVEELDPPTIRQVCPLEGSSFEQYACLHGLGHGLVLATNYHLGRSLDLCAMLETPHARNSCYGGAFMENVVAYMDHARGGGHAHHEHGDHGHGGTPSFWVTRADPTVPCSIVDEEYQRSCWLMQTSLILFLNQGDLQATAATCDTLEEPLVERCYRSLGRDISARTNHNPAAGSQNCAYASSSEYREACIIGWIANVITHHADPSVGIPLCNGFDAADRPACYQGVGSTGRTMVTNDELGAICAQAEEGYEIDCRRGGRIR